MCCLGLLPRGRLETSAPAASCRILIAEWRHAMRSVHLLLVLSVGVIGVAWLVFSSGNRHRKPEVVSNPVADLVIGEPIVWENLAIFPVSSRVPKHSDRFITLD